MDIYSVGLLFYIKQMVYDCLRVLDVGDGFKYRSRRIIR
jgi:hypothetical protein